MELWLNSIRQCRRGKISWFWKTNSVYQPCILSILLYGRKSWTPICKHLYSTALYLKDNCKHDLKFIYLDSWELLVYNYSGWKHSFQKRVKRIEVKRYQQLKNKTQCNKAEPINSDLCFMLQIYLRYNNVLPILHEVFWQMKELTWDRLIPSTINLYIL